jgi:hypothetical protein
VGPDLLYAVPGHTHLDTPQDNDITWPNSLLNVLRIGFRKEIRENKE